MKYLIVPLWLAFALLSADASTIYVPSQQPNIQAGINAAVDGDTVMVAPGTYDQTFHFMGKNIVVTSSEGPEVTTISATGGDSAVVYFVMGEPKGAELSGFTVTGGTSSGIAVDASSPTIKGNIITGNETVTYGSGGGIRMTNTTGALIYGNVIHDNTADNYGGAVSMRNSVYDTIAYNVIYSNAGSGQIYIVTSTITDLQVYNNTISTTEYVGIYNLGFGTMYARNNIVVNSPGYGIMTIYGETVAEYNCMYNNYQDFSFLVGSTNLSADPLFSDEAGGDYSLRESSPCIDAGDPDSAYNDIDGTRNDMGALPHLVGSFPIAVEIGFGTGPEGNTMFASDSPIAWTYFDTAYSSQAQYQVQVGTDNDWSVAEMWDSGPVASPEEMAVYAGSPLLDHQTYFVRVRLSDGSQWGDWRYDWFITRFTTVIAVPGDYATIQEAVNTSFSGDTIYVASGTYTGPGNRDIDFGGRNILLTSMTAAALTIIDCSGDAVDHRGFYIHSGEDSTAIIDGFTVTGAAATDGAMALMNAGPTIRNCVVTGNSAAGIYAGQEAPNYVRNAPIVENCVISDNTKDGVWWIANGRLTGCDISGNGQNGITLVDPKEVVVTQNLLRNNASNGINIWAMSSGVYKVWNNTVFGNNVGLYYYYEPPRATDDGTVSNADGAPISYNIMAFNATYGVVGEGLGLPASITECNDSYGNPSGDYYPEYPYGPYAGDDYGNISSNPLFCGASGGDFTLSSASACAATNNSCGVLIGAFDVGCYTCCRVMRGNIDGDAGDEIDIGDLVYLVIYMFQDGPEPPCREEANVDGLGVAPNEIDVADLVYLVNYMFQSGPPPADCP